MDQLAGDDALLLFVLGQELLQLHDRIVHQLAGDDEAAHLGGGQFEFEVAEDALADGHQPARAGVFVGGQLGDAPQAVVAEEHFDAVGGEGLFVLTDDAALGVFRMGNRSSTFSGWQTTRTGSRPMNSGSKPNSMKSRVWAWSSAEVSAARAGAGWRREADGGLAQALLDDLFQAVERAADDEQDVLGVDGGWALSCRAG